MATVDQILGPPPVDHLLGPPPKLPSADSLLGAPTAAQAKAPAGPNYQKTGTPGVSMGPRAPSVGESGDYWKSVAARFNENMKSMGEADKAQKSSLLGGVDPRNTLKTVGGVIGVIASPLTGGIDAGMRQLYGGRNKFQEGLASPESVREAGDLAESLLPAPKFGAAARGVEEAGGAVRGALKKGAADHVKGVSAVKKLLARAEPEAAAVVKPAERLAAAPAKTLAAKVEKPAVDELLGPAPAANPRREPSATKPPAPPVEHPEGDVVGNEPKPIERIDNAFYRAGGRATAAKLDARDTLKALPPELRDEKVQEELTHAIEEKLVNPAAEIPEHLKPAYEAYKPFAERQRAAINERNAILEDMGVSPKDFAEYEPVDETGYVPRNVVGKSRAFDSLDPSASGRNALDRGGGNMNLKGALADIKGRLSGKPPQGKTTALSTFSKSQKARTQMVWHNPATGERTLIPSDDRIAAGDVKEGPFGVELTARPATIKEVEAGTDIRYHKNATANVVDRALHDERVVDNLKVLRETTRQMADEGLAHRESWHYKNDAGEWVRQKANSETPEGYRAIPNVKALEGWTFAPELHQLLTDVLPKNPDSFLDTIGAVNRAINASLFITPFPHIKNVGTMAFVGRGWDNFNPAAYPRFVRTSAQAIKEVTALGPKYREWLREGAGLQAGDEATRNFHESMLKMFSKQIEKEPGIAKAFGVSPADLVKGVYKASHTALWNVNDMIMFQRYLELKEKGLDTRAAIKETERWIANYRIPPQVMGSRFFKEFLSNGVFTNFGRYEYGKLKAMGSMVRDLTKGSGAQKIDAAGKAASLAFLGVFVYPLMDMVAKKATGNDNAYVTPGGQLNMAESAMNVGASAVDYGIKAAGKDTDGPLTFTPREKAFADDLAGFITPAPLAETLFDVQGGKWGTNTPEGMAKYGAGKFYPAELAEKTADQGPRAGVGELLGVNTPQSDRTPENQIDIPASMLKAFQKRKDSQ